MTTVNYNVASIILLLISIALSVIGQVFFKKGALNIESYDNIILAVVLNSNLIIGFILYTVSAILYILSLRHIPLTVAYPSISFGYILVFLLGYFLFGEVITLNKVIGVSLICMGILFIWR